jgi:molybdopterin converting factor small subunit
MQVKLLAFAQAQDRLGFHERLVECDAGESPRELLARIAPAFEPASARVAVDCEYIDWDAPLGAASEIALIPPVSGG